jgi:hypothetical protein
VKTDQFSITKACKEKGRPHFDAAKDFLKWFCGPGPDSLTYSYAKERLSMRSCYSSLNDDLTIRANWASHMDVDLVDQQARFAISLQDFSPVHKTSFYLLWVNEYLIPNLQAAIQRTESIEKALNTVNDGFMRLSREFGLPNR